MKWWQYLILVLAAFVLLIITVRLTLGDQFIDEQRARFFNLLVDTSLLLFIFFWGAFTGFITHMLLHVIDDIILRNRKLEAWQSALPAILLGLTSAVAQVYYMQIFMRIPDTWPRNVAMTDFGLWPPWSGTFVNPPIGWGVYALITFLFTYFILRSVDR